MRKLLKEWEESMRTQYRPLSQEKWGRGDVGTEVDGNLNGECYGTLYISYMRLEDDREYEARQKAYSLERELKLKRKKTLERTAAEQEAKDYQIYLHLKARFENTPSGEDHE